MSLNQVLTQTGSGGTFDGWQVATLGQIHLFMIHAGWVGPFDSSNASNMGFIANFKALTTSLLDDSLSGMGDSSLTDDPVGQYGDTSFSDDPITGLTSYSFTTPVDPAVGQQGTGTFLVRASAVPLPAAVWLFLTGLAGLAGIGRFRRSRSVS